MEEASSHVLYVCAWVQTLPAALGPVSIITSLTATHSTNTILSGTGHGATTQQ